MPVQVVPALIGEAAAAALMPVALLVIRLILHPASRAADALVTPGSATAASLSMRRIPCPRLIVSLAEAPASSS